MIFKKELQQADLVDIEKNARAQFKSIGDSVYFIRAYGEYKLRKNVRLTDKEYQENISNIQNDIKNVVFKLLVATAIIKKNGLEESYNKIIKSLGEALSKTPGGKESK